MSNFDEKLYDYLLESNIITPNFIHALRIKMLVYFKCLKSIDIYCDTIKLEFIVTLKFKWYKFFKKDIIRQIRAYIEYIMPEGDDIVIEKNRDIVTKRKPYNIEIRY